MQIQLAPMEGLVDPLLRRLLSRIGGFDHCVTEFIRVTDVTLPTRVFRRIAPELDQGWHTDSGTPVFAQLLGSNPELMGRNACKAARLGAPVVDLNFGCPAKTVNRHRGGAVLLDEPQLLYHIVQAVRAAVPPETPVTAKMRLGYSDQSRAVECGQALEAGGASAITIHARTKVDGYRPPAYWRSIAPVRNAVSIPVIANGEIWRVEDYYQCREESECADVMIGRGLIARPDLALQIRQSLAGEPVTPWSWSDLAPLVCEFFDGVRAEFETRHMNGRLKQWINYLRLTYPEAEQLWQRIRKERDPIAAAQALRASAASAHRSNRPERPCVMTQ